MVQSETLYKIYNFEIRFFDKNRLRYNFDFATTHSTGFFLKKKIFDKYGVFNTKYICSADYDLYYRLILKINLLEVLVKKIN